MIRSATNARRSPQYVSPIQWNSAQDDIIDLLDRLENTILAAEKGALSAPTGKGMCKFFPVDSWNILTNVHTTNDVTLCIRNIIIEAVKNAESLSGFAGWVSIITCIEGIKRHIRHRRYTQNDNENSCRQDDIINILQQLAALSRPSSLGNMKKIVAQLLNDELSRNLVLNSYELVGADGQIFIHKDVASETLVELIDGYKFACKVDPRFIASTKLRKWDRSSPKMYIIDGIIETVSEVNRILEDASKQKHPGILMCLGFSEEVIATLSVNYLRGSLDIIPISPGFGLEDINMLTDIAVVVGSDVVSSHKGDLVSSLDPDEVACVDRVTVDHRGMLIHNSASKAWVLPHVRNLVKKRDEEDVTDKINLINLRLAGLTSRYCHIKLSEKLLEESSLIMGRVEAGIKIGREISKFGTINIDLAIEKLRQDGENIVIETVGKALQHMSNSGIHEISSSALILGVRSGLSCSESISSTGYFLTSN